MERIATFAHSLVPTHVAWSPDGLRVATVSAGTTTHNIEIFDVAGGSRLALSHADAINWSYSGPSLAWTSNDTIAYLKGDPRMGGDWGPNGPTYVMEVSTHEAGALPATRGELPGGAYAIVGRADETIFLLRTRGRRGIATGVIREGRMPLSVKEVAPSSAASTRSPVGWLGPSGFAYVDFDGERATLLFDHDDRGDAPFWRGRVFNSIPTMSGDAFVTWDDANDPERCAMVLHDRRGTHRMPNSREGAPVCASSMRCASGKPEACVIMETRAGSTSLSAFDVERGARGRLIHLSQSEDLARGPFAGRRDDRDLGG